MKGNLAVKRRKRGNQRACTLFIPSLRATTINILLHLISQTDRNRQHELEVDTMFPSDSPELTLEASFASVISFIALCVLTYRALIHLSNIWRMMMSARGSSVRNFALTLAGCSAPKFISTSYI